MTAAGKMEPATGGINSSREWLQSFSRGSGNTHMAFYNPYGKPKQF